MRQFINIVSEEERRPNDPTPSALKFWITDTGEIKFIGSTHHFDYIMASRLTWGEVFDNGWIRGFVEEKLDIVCFDFDRRKLNKYTRRAMMKVIKDFTPSTIIWEDTRSGAFYGSERVQTREFQDFLRETLVEEEHEDSDELYWFWFNPATMELHPVWDGTHTLAAIEELNIPGMDEIEYTNDLEDVDVLNHAMMNNWVRGRYDNNQLMLQGKRRNVHKCAKWVAERYLVTVLYVDFVEDQLRDGDFSQTSSTVLRGQRLEFFLNRGWVPSQMIREKLSEGVFKISTGGSFSEFKMWENPTSRQTGNLMHNVDEVRGLIDDRGDLYVWDAYEATHHAVAKELGLVIEHQFSISGDIVEGDYVESLNKNRNFVRAFGTELRNGFDDNELFEAPISDISHIGDWEKNSSFRHEQDRKLLTNPKAVTKIKSMWRFPDDITYNIILINNAEANRWTEEGVVPHTKLKEMFPRTFSEIAPLIRDDEVNIIFTNNKGDARVPMTGWVMAHRFGHAMLRYQKNYYFNEAVAIFERHLAELMDDYGVRSDGYRQSTPALTSTVSRHLAHAIGTFKSARDRKLRNTFEMIHELFAQYIITGTVKFNPPPRYIKAGNKTFIYKYDDEMYERTVSAVVNDIPYEMNPYFESAIHSVVGKVLVM